MTKDDNLDASILSCLINSRQKEISAQLRLAQKWNRADIARNSILNSRRPFTDQSQFYGLFRENLVENRVEFVRLFIDKGFDVSKYLNETRLHELYNFTVIT